MRSLPPRKHALLRSTCRHADTPHGGHRPRPGNVPALLVLDGVSANSGKEGLEGDRIVDMYRLFSEVAGEYGNELQLIIVDNDLPVEVADELASSIVLTLSKESRLIGAPTSPVETEA